MRRLLVPAGVAGVALLAGAYLLLANRPEPSYQGPVAAARQQLSDVDESEIVAMTLTPRGGQTVRLEREGAVWRVREPYPFRWDWDRLQELRASFARLFAQRLVVEDPEDRAQYGLSPPAVVAGARLESGRTLEFHLGNPTASGEAYYLSSRDDPAVFTVHAIHGKRFTWTVADLRDQAVPALDADRVNRIYFRDGDYQVELAAVGEQPRYAHLPGSRIMRVPYVAAADPERFAAIARRVAEMPISAAVAGDRAGFGLDPPRGELRVRDFRDELHLLIGAAEAGQVYVKMPGAADVRTAPAAALDFLTLTPFELLNPRVLSLPEERLQALTLRSGGREYRIDLQRSTDDLHGQRVTAVHAGEPLDPDAYAALLAELADLTADAPAPPRQASGGPAGDPVLTVTFHLRAAERATVTARFLPYDRDFRLLRWTEGIDVLVDSRAVTALTERVETTFIGPGG